MKKHVNLLALPENVLAKLTNKEAVVKSEHGELTFVSREVTCHSKGYQNDVVVFQCDGKYFRFQATEYLDGYWSYTIPFEVFRKEVQRPVILYTNWIEEGE